MKPRSILTVVLLVFVAASVGYMVVSETGKEKPAEAVAGTSENDGDKTVVYYFHATKRCLTCRTIESYTEEAITSGFGDQIADGKMEWKSINLDLPENEHFVEDYQLATRTVVLVEKKNGTDIRWSRLDRVWELVHDKEQFVSYIRDETDDFLADQNG
jgi:hypothetical protein